MRFSLVICTYMRPQPLLRLLNSVKKQTVYPNEILIIDGSVNNETEDLLKQNSYKNLRYYRVDETNRGLTKQRNYGINLVSETSGIICFLDDDTILCKEYFNNLIKVFESDEKITGVGGIATNENKWELNKKQNYSKKKYLSIDGYHVKLGQRHIVRNYLGIGSNQLPGIMPEFSNGLSCGYPINDKNYEVDLLIGMSMSFRKIVINNIKFSTYFEGYGLYEDADYSLRALKYGKNVIATSVLLEHYHDGSGRPNQYRYGKMVIRNGWYVWRVKYPKPSLKAKFKWHATAILLTKIRILNIVTTSNKKEAFTESLGRIVGWFSLIFNAPKVES